MLRRHAVLHPLLATFVFVVCLPFSTGFCQEATAFKLEKHEAGVRVLQNGELVADYLTQSKSKPIVWPLIGPEGSKMTRNYPMLAEQKGEKYDHPHHRSLWFTHGDVNGTDFWLEGGKGGIIKHEEFTSLKDGKSAIIETKNAWLTSAGDHVLSDRRKLTFTETDLGPALDFDITLIADTNDVNFGDTKEGSFGIRIAGSMTVDRNGGTITNSEGQQNKNAWGKPAKWVDYTGMVTTASGESQRMGIAIFNHPSSFHYPTRWHVRTYGLFAANPFGVHHFLNQKKPTEGVVLQKGKTLELGYRVLLHQGDTDPKLMEKAFTNYANTNR